jgi:hypothetical protein
LSKLESSASPLLASPQGGVAVSSKKYREATEATQPGWFSLLFLSENHPGLAMRMLRGIFLDRSATPPCGDARRGLLVLDSSWFKSSP